MQGVNRAAAALGLTLACVLNAKASPGLASYERQLVYIDVAPPCAPQCLDRTGSGFVAWRDDRATYIVTAAHVTGAHPRQIHVYIGDDTSVDYRAQLVAADEARDVAIIATSKALQADVAHMASAPAAGGRVYSVGYGREAVNSLQNSGEIRPIMTTGLVSRAAANGQFVSSSRSEEGQSGGPMLDDAGDVVGIVRAEPVTGEHSNTAFYAVGAETVARVLADHHIPYQADFNAKAQSDDDLDVASGPIRDADGIGRFAYAQNADGTVSYVGQNAYSSGAVIQNVGVQIENALRRASGADIVQAYAMGTDEKDVARLAGANRTAGGVFLILRFDARAIEPFTNRLDASTEVWVVGERGGVWFHDKESYEKQRYFMFAQSEVESILAGLISNAFTKFTAEMGGASGFADLNRFGVPVAVDQRSAFAEIVLANGHASAALVAPAGVAGLAGLRDGDEVARINGRDATSYAQADIEAILHGNGRVELTIAGADGREYTVSFVPETVRWYVEHAQRP